jgi:hypothetical protein
MCLFFAPPKVSIPEMVRVFLYVAKVLFVEFAEFKSNLWVGICVQELRC